MPPRRVIAGGRTASRGMRALSSAQSSGMSFFGKRPKSRTGGRQPVQAQAVCRHRKVDPRAGPIAGHGPRGRKGIRPFWGRKSPSSNGSANVHRGHFQRLSVLPRNYCAIVKVYLWGTCTVALARARPEASAALPPTAGASRPSKANGRERLPPIAAKFFY